MTSDPLGAEPFSVAVPDSALEDLRARLRNTRWPDQVSDPWDYGTDLGYLRSLLRSWADEFDWRAQERRINGFSQFRANLDGLRVHFIHERGRGPSPTPLLLLHGWPSSFVQMLDIVPMLTDPDRFGGDPADSFDVVVPSLPGFGFSDRPRKPGMSVARIARLLASLMRDLGYERCGIRASDLGAGIAPRMAVADPGAVIGLHLNATNPFADDGGLPDDLSEREQEMLAAARAFRATEAG